MLRQSTLTNMLDTVYDQTINGKRYMIKPGETVTLNRNEAVDVKGWYIGYNKPVSLKINHLPDDDDAAAAAKVSAKIFCSPDGKEFKTKEECHAYMETVIKKKG
jgi:hypothetical protein